MRVRFRVIIALMKRLVLGIAAVLVAVALAPLAVASTQQTVPTGATGATGTTGTTGPTGPKKPPCPTVPMHIQFTRWQATDPTGKEIYLLTVRNGYTKSCALGQPTVTLISKFGKYLPSHSIASSTATVVGPYVKEYSKVSFSPTVPGLNDNQKGRCAPKAYRIKIAFAGSAGKVSSPVTPPTQVCEQGTMTLAPFTTRRPR
jgi:hypothetical protein